MRACLVAALFLLCQAPVFGQAFDVASVKASQNLVGPDYNNRIAISDAGISGKNITLKRLIAEAYRVQLDQVIGPSWFDKNEYDVEAKAETPIAAAQLIVMLQRLLAERFKLMQHRENRRMSVYQLVVDKRGPKIQPAKGGETPKAETGFHFHGDMRQLADLLAVQLTIPESSDPDPARPRIARGSPIPVLDKTGLAGTYDFGLELREPDANPFTQWQRILRDRLGLQLESGRANVSVVVVDAASQVPTAN